MTKRFAPWMIVLFGSLFLASFLTAQTSVPVGQVRGATSTNGTVFLALPNGTMVLADIGPEFTIDVSGPRPVLRAVLPAMPSEVIGERLTASGASGLACTLTKPLLAGSLKVWLNGVRQAEGVDYAVSGQTVTFIPFYAGALTSPGTVILADYKTP